MITIIIGQNYWRFSVYFARSSGQATGGSGMARFGAALKDAEEVRSARERLEEVVLKAMVDHAGSMSATETAIWER
jgi:hypothetical protein